MDASWHREAGAGWVRPAATGCDSMSVRRGMPPSPRPMRAACRGFAALDVRRWLMEKIAAALAA
jgi:hypothetical protein